MGGITTSNCFEFKPILWQPCISRRRALSQPASLLYCHSSESRWKEQVGVSPNNCPRKQPLGAFHGPYMAPLIPPLIVREKAVLTRINNCLYCRPCCRCNVLEEFCKRDQATLPINSAGASAANEVKHRYRNLFQLKKTLLHFASVCVRRAEVRKERK